MEEFLYLSDGVLFVTAYQPGAAEAHENGTDQADEREEERSEPEPVSSRERRGDRASGTVLAEGQLPGGRTPRLEADDLDAMRAIRAGQAGGEDRDITTTVGCRLDRRNVASCAVGEFRLREALPAP